jgi:hypothetical protein
MTDDNDDSGHETRLTRREALRGGSAAAVAAGSALLSQHLVRRAQAASAGDARIIMGSAPDPDTNGEISFDGTDIKAYSGGALRNFSDIGSGSGVSDHGNLSGLNDDDHTQYFLADGTRNVTGDIADDQGNTIWDYSAQTATPPAIDIDDDYFVSTGDFYPKFGASVDDISTTSNSYSGSRAVRLRWDEAVDSQAKIGILVAARAVAAGDQIDIRVRDVINSATVWSKTGITSDQNFVEKQTFSPSNRAVRVALDVEIRNSNGSTTVQLFDPAVEVGVSV